MNLAVNLFQPESIITSLGLIGLLSIIFAESGLLIGIAFPGDSLLFVAGIAASSAGADLLNGATLDPLTVFLGAPLAAIAGAQVGHFLGAKFGSALFNRPDGRFFTHERVAKTEKWLVKYGVGKAVILARFVPFVRTLLNPMVGTIRYPGKKFFLWNVIGAIIWTQSVLALGYLLGNEIKGSVDKVILPIVAIIILVSVVPVALELLREWRTKRDLS